MARQSVYALKLQLALALRGGQAARSELMQMLGRASYLNEAVVELSLPVESPAVIEDRAAGVLRLQRGRACELLGLARAPAVQHEMFSEGCLLDDPPGNEARAATSEQLVSNPVCGPPAPLCVAPTASPISRDNEISELGTRDLELMEAGTRLGGKAKARFEQAQTDRAVAVAASYRHDAYLMEKLDRQRGLREELFGGRTPTARKFAVLHASAPARARELLGESVLARNARAMLNVLLRVEGVRY